MRRTLLLAAVVGIALAATAPAADARERKIVTYPVTFSVQNVNRSKAVCATDGAAYRVRGHVTGPRSVLGPRARPRARRRAVTLYLHGLSLGEWFWTFRGRETSSAPPGVRAPVGFPVIRGYDYAAAQARAGHVSVTIDRLGYGASDHPDGRRSCLGGHADIAHQVVQALRSGSYDVHGGQALRYRRVALAGHSIGAEIAMIESYSFRDVDALVAMSFSFQNLPRAQLALGPTRDTCLAGGRPAYQSSPGYPPAPGGYAPYGTGTPADFASIMLHSARAPVAEAATALRTLDPCGDTDSIIPALLQQQSEVARLRLPVLVVCGTRDALYSALGCRMQAERFRRSRRVNVELVRNAGHAIAVERPASTFRRKVSRWLERRGF